MRPNQGENAYSTEGLTPGEIVWGPDGYCRGTYVENLSDFTGNYPDSFYDRLREQGAVAYHVFTSQGLEHKMPLYSIRVVCTDEYCMVRQGLSHGPWGYAWINVTEGLEWVSKS